MQMHPLRCRAMAFVVGLAIFSFSTWAVADPPSRVARLGYVAGAVSFSPAGENDWVKASLNRPLGNGDRLWTEADGGARAEMQVGGATIRMNAGTSLSVLNLDDRIVQMQVTQGSLHVRVRRLEPNQVFEVDTPNLAFTLRQPGEYRIDVDPESDATTIVVRRGKGEAWGEDAAYVIDAQQAYRFAGSGLRDYQQVSAPRSDKFDRWTANRDRSFDNSRSARYVSPDVVGYQDLDANGSWRVEAGYGNVWVPNRVATEWVPYSNGHWAWVDPWGWTWIDDAPWGFAVSHYGRWANLHGTWAWVPGPVRSRAYYAPALVAFVGGSNFQLSIAGSNVGAVAWFPLAPREVYRPSYPVSRRYFENINQSNTVINNTTIINQYNNSNVGNVVHANREITGAVVAVAASAFVQAQPVSRAEQRISPEAIAGRPVLAVPALAPTEKSVHGAAGQGDKPPPRAFARPVVARTAVPAAPAGLAAQRVQLDEKPGRPLDEDKRKELKPAAAVPAPVIKVLPPRSEAQQPLRQPPAVRAEDARPPTEARREAAPPVAAALPPSPSSPAKGETNGKPEGRGQPVTAPLPVKPETSRETPVQPAAPRGKPEPDSRSRREQPLAPVSEKAPITKPAGADAKPGTARDAAPPSPTTPAKSETNGKREAREQPVTPLPMAKPARPDTPREKAVQPPDPRGKSEPEARPEPRGPQPQPVAVPARPEPVAVQPPEVRKPAPPEKVAPPAQPVVAPEIAARPAKVQPAPEPKGKAEGRGKDEQSAAPPVQDPPPPPPAKVQPQPQRPAPPPPPAAPAVQHVPPAVQPVAPPAAPANDRQRGRSDAARDDDKRKPEK